MTVFNPDGTYKENYRKELNRKILHTFHGYVVRDKSKDKFLRHKSYDEFVELDELLKDLKPTKKGIKDMQQRGRPAKKQPNEETTKTMADAKNGVVNKYETITEVFDKIEQEIIVDSVETKVEVTPSKPVRQPRTYTVRDIDALKGLPELTVVTSLLAKQLYANGIINLNPEEILRLDADVTNPNAAFILVMKILFNRFTEKGVFDFTDEEYSKLLSKYRAFLSL